MRLYIARHGECQAQVDPERGREPDTPLTERGREQARDLGRRLAAERLTHVLSSPLVRALETASIVAEMAGDRLVEIIPDLREGWSETRRGPTRAELRERFPRALVPSELGDGEWEMGADAMGTVRARANGVLTELRARFGDEDRVAIVTHGGLFGALMNVILGLPPEAACWFDLGNCALTIVRLLRETDRVSWALYPSFVTVVECVNDGAHLTPPVP